MDKKKLVDSLTDFTHVHMGFEIGVNKNLKPGTMIIIPNKDDISINDLFIVTNLAEDGTNKIEPFKPVEPALSNEDYWQSLVMTLIQMARQERMDEYRKTKKEIKRLMLEDKDARTFFQKTIGAVGSIKI
jgi:hypothetical protein